MWSPGLRSGGRLCWLALGLLLSLLPLSSWAEPSAREAAALAALSQAEAALSKAEAALSEAGKALDALKEGSAMLSEALKRSKLEVETLKGEYETRLRELEALRMQSAELKTSLTASQEETRRAENWAFGLGAGFLLALLGWIFL
jgi:septal ring factor EnvC (AmiA/AmiB activator)